MAEKKEVVVVAVTEERVAALIAEALKNLVTIEQLKSVMDQTLRLADSAHSINERLGNLEEQVTGFVSSRLESVAPLMIGETAQEPFDPDWLEGLTFNGAHQKEVEEEGRKKLVSVLFERALRLDDVLSWKVSDDTVILVTADGRKHQVEI